MTAPKSILLVDDDRDILESLRLALQGQGYDVDTASNGTIGLAKTEQRNYDVIVLDMMMPQRSGFLVVETLRQTRPEMPRIIMMTANEGSRHREYADRLGVDAYLKKPFPIDQLLTTIKKLFE